MTFQIVLHITHYSLQSALDREARGARVLQRQEQEQDGGSVRLLLYLFTFYFSLPYESKHGAYRFHLLMKRKGFCVAVVTLLFRLQKNQH